MVSSKFDLAAVQVIGKTLVDLSDARLKLPIVLGRAALMWCNVTFSFQNLIFSSADLAIPSQRDKLILSLFYEAIWEDAALISATSVTAPSFRAENSRAKYKCGETSPSSLW